VTHDYIGRLLQLFRCTTCLVVTIHDLLFISFSRGHGRSSASVAYSFSYGGIRAVLHSFWSGSYAYSDM
jgi:hypothetical protein